MDSLELVMKHLSPEVPFILNNEDGSKDTIMLKPFNVGQQTLAFSISKKMGKSKNEKGELEMNEDIVKDMFDLFSSIVKRAIPGINDETTENFVTTNFEALSEVLEQLSPKPKNQEKIDLIKKRFEERKEIKNE